MSTENNSSRKLAAILFADIVGYTSMMQKGEASAMSKLNRFEEVTKSAATKNQGEVIKSYGDGSLLLFPSTVNALQCAYEMQIAFQEDPKVPLRIGIHIGEIIRKGQDIFGNGVNIASRVESMGVAGAILISGEARKKIKNQERFQTESLGRFEFKNVEEPMEVFALANEGFPIPQREEMQGKLKVKNNSWRLPAAIGVALLIAFGAWMYSTYSTGGQFSLSEEKVDPLGDVLLSSVLSQRVAVVPFQNNTNDTNLDIMGKMAADWINRGLMEIEDAEVVSPSTVNQNIHALGILPNNLEKKYSFSELTGARNFIQGTFYKEKEELIFLVELVDAIDGKIEFKFPRIRGNIDNKEDLITQLRERISGYWAARDMVDNDQIKAPTYESYQSFLNALQGGVQGFELLENSISLDTTFYLARIHFLNLNRIGIYGSNKIHFEFLERHKTKLSEYELGWYNYLIGAYSGDAQLAYSSLNSLRKKYPKDFILNYEIGMCARRMLNNPELVLDIYDQLPIEQVSASSVDMFYYFRISTQIISYIELNRTDELRDFIKKIDSDLDNDISWFYNSLLLEALFSNNQEKIDKAYQQFVKGYSNDKFTDYAFIATGIYRSTISKPIHNQIRNDAISWYYQLEKGSRNYIVWQNYIARLEGNIDELNTDNLQVFTIAAKIGHAFNAAMAFIDAGRNNEISPFIERLKELTIKDYETSSVWGSGYAHYALGVIYTNLGQFDDALFNLKMARQGGVAGSFASYQYDSNLEPLFGIPAFEELTKPIWPEVKD